MTVSSHRLSTASYPTSVDPEMTGAQIIIEILLKEGVTAVFGYPGGAVLPIYDELFRASDKLTHYLARHEQGAVHMADGFARSSGQVGVALVTSGPGATNAVTGLATAFMDSVPLVVLTGQVASTLVGTDAFQEIDTFGITRHCSKHNFLVWDVHDLSRILQEAFQIARSGRPGPVVVDIPKDITLQKTRWEPIAKEESNPSAECAVDPTQLKKANELLNNATRPILYVGGGVVSSGASSELIDFAERLQVPVTSTLMGLGAFPSRHPLFLGMLGMHGTYCANMSISEADLIIAVGVRFDDRVTGKLETFAPNAHIIHLDIDANSIDKLVIVDVALHGDAKIVLDRWLCSLQDSPFNGISRIHWLSQIRKWQDDVPLPYQSSESEIMPQHLLQELYTVTQGKAIISTDVGQHQMWAAQYHLLDGPRQWLTSGGLGTMGFGFPAAIGAKIANPDKTVIAIVGDGGFQMTCAELSTAVQYGADVKVVVMNNGYLGMVRQWQEIFYENRYSQVAIPSPDFCKLAEAHGATGLRTRSPKDLGHFLKTGLNTPGVVVMDVEVAQQNNVFPMVPSGASLKEMVLR